MEYKTIFKEISPYNSELLKVDDIHEVYFEESGNPNGAPVVFVHGGPGCGCGDLSRRFLDPNFYRIICIDQRGCGRSKPFLELKDNTTDNLAKDMEKIREYLNIEKWLVHGGSWGTTLSLYYAENYPQRVVGLILRGIFLGRDEDIKWLYQGGAGMFFPETFETFTKNFDEEESKDYVKSYYKYLMSNDYEIKKKFGKSFSVFENSVVALNPRQISDKITDEDISMAMMECHYFVNNCFFEENYILKNAYKIKDIPTIIIHGRYDVDCRPVGAYLLHKKLNNSKLIFPIAGHTSFDPPITHELILAQEEFKKLF
ncbi:MAG: prolyl aminopeptidase [Peptoniphilaceae bacterium]|uniref:prolyl aminopeptidase n=1 Tax=Parvimonas sp. TaxID=1944660 RepID=UPI0025E63CDF|nr:prolyl aminopeptidase [Parvimonas sp.]MCI5998082.1 prolyl aminopeptidase [Parvimonas sp.]MDD7764154.1 prolyl aminopeptidase [Peptoniphilaceae bacterium]MDY3050731.1 prolyl aminopeptidase [Parvimonas sp.]